MGNGLIIERTRNLAEIKSLATHPAIFKHVSDDSTTAEQWEPIDHEEIIYLIARDAQGAFGFGIFMPQNIVCFRGHFAFLPRSYGDVALTAFKLMLDWMWNTTSAHRITGEILRENRRAIQFAIKAGCNPYGINLKSKLVGGVLRDQVAMGISRPS